MKMEVKGDILTIEVDLSKRLGPSKSGKTIMIANSEGFQSVPDVSGVKISLNAYTKEKD